jgi:hypothetical protein
VVAEQASGAAFAATWRDVDNQMVATTWGGTMCWFPRLPWRLRIAREGFEHVVRCGECPGCLEFERRRLADRLAQKYGAQDPRLGRKGIRGRDGCPGDRKSTRPELWIVRIYAPLERHAALAHALHRRRGLTLEPGFWRLGRSSFAVLGCVPLEIAAAVKQMGLRCRVERVRFSRGRRAWRSLTAGIAVSRAAYGEQTKRWYARGLPASDRKKWDVIKLSAYKPYSRWASPRAWKSGNLVLVPPEVWRMKRVDRVALRKSMSMAATPELAAAVAQVLAAQSSQSAVMRSEKSGFDRPQAAPSKTIPPLIEEGGYRSSGQSQGEFWAPPRRDEDLDQPGASGDPVWMEREREIAARSGERKKTAGRRVLDESLAIIERMQKLAEKRGRND